MSIVDLLITKLIEETCAETIIKNDSGSDVDLRKYFENRLNEVNFGSILDYLEQYNLNHLPLHYEAMTGCYRLNYNQSIIDFPSNWSIFKDIADSSFIYIDQDQDQDFLLDVFFEISGSFQNIALVNNNKKIVLIFLPEEKSSEHVNWIKNYFNKLDLNSGNSEEVEVA